MSLGEPHKNFVAYRNSSDVEAPIRNVRNRTTISRGLRDTQPISFAFGINALNPPFTDSPRIMQRADEVNTIQRMLTDKHTSSVIVVGTPGAGKSTLAALLFQRLKLAQQAGMPAPRYLVWLGLNTYTSLPDLIVAILRGVGVKEPKFYLMTPDQQMSVLLQALRRPQANALIVLDQFEVMLHPETSQGVAGRGVLPLFLELLRTDLGASRFLLTGYSSPFEQPNPNMEQAESRVRSYLVSHISMPEGVALLQQRGIQGSPEELSLVWQRCTGQVFALVLFSSLVNLSGISLSYLLTSPDYKPMWAGEVTFNLITAVLHFLNNVQNALMRALCLFYEPAPLQGVCMTIAGNNNPLSSEHIGRFDRELSILTRHGIVLRVVNWAGETCYMLHPLFRQYIQEYYLENVAQRSTSQVGLVASVPPNPTPPKPEDLQAALTAGHMNVANYYQYLARTQCPSRDQRQGLQDVLPLIAAIRHLCLGGSWQNACELLFEEGLHESMVQWGAWNSLIGLYTALLPPLGVLLRRDEGLVASLVGMLYGRMSEYKQSQAYFEQALNIQRQIGDHQGEISTLINRGELMRTHGKLAQARQDFEQALKLSGVSSNPPQQRDASEPSQLANDAQALRSDDAQRSRESGVSGHLRDDTSTATQSSKLQGVLPQSGGTSGEYNDAFLKSALLHNLGLLAHSERRHQEAFHYYTEALKLAHNTRAQQNRGMILTNLGMLIYEQNLQKEGLALLLLAQQIRQSQQDLSVPMLSQFLALLEQKMGPQAYRQLYQEAIAMQQQVLSRFASLGSAKE